MSILDDGHDFMSDYVSATDHQIDAMTLYAFATHGMDAWVTFGRLLFYSELEESGKTHAMNITLSLSANPMDTEGTQFAMQAAMLAASNTPETPTPSLYRDEISDVTSRNGMSGGRNPIMKYLRKGYKRGATDMVSRQGVDERYSIFTPFLMTGLRPACVPRDVRSRCISIRMLPGKPRRYFDVREAEPYAAGLQTAISQAVKSQIPALSRFRARGMHPKLTARKLEVWEPLLAIAYVLGGQRWLNRGVAAFTALALDESDHVSLTPRQMVIRDVAMIAETLTDGTEETFIGGLAIADEMMRLDNPLYVGRSAASLSCLIRDSVPVDSEQRRLGGVPVRGYPVSALTAAWECEQPSETDDVDIPEEENPFDVTGVTDDESDPDDENMPLTSSVTGVTAVTGQNSTPQVASLTE